MKEQDTNTLLTMADEAVAEQFMAFLLRCSESKRQYDDLQLMSEITAKRLMNGLKKSGFVLMKRATTPIRSEYSQPQLNV